MPTRCYHKVTAREQQLVVERCTDDGRVFRSSSASSFISYVSSFSSPTIAVAAAAAAGFVEVLVIGPSVEAAPRATVASDQSTRRTAAFLLLTGEGGELTLCSCIKPVNKMK